MAWVTAKHSKREITRAGEQLLDEKLDEVQRLQAMAVLSNWRAAHAYPMHAVLITLRTMAREADKNAIVVQRLKRTPSIIGKMQRYPSMNLSRMQDIAGCRAVVNTVKEVKKLTSKITTSRTRNKLHKTHDYINQPKESGYRGIHLIYKYGGEKAEYSDYFVEIQVRTKIQHAWATAVEIIDTFTKQALKTSKGKQEWLDFFRYVSAEFAKLEKTPTGIVDDIDTKAEVIRLAHKLNVINLLNAYAVSTKYVTKKNDNKTDYFLLELTEHAHQLRVTQFGPSELQIATEQYLLKEEQAKIDDSYNVVLVSANNVHALKAAYPNYFAQSKDFLKHLNTVLKG